MKIVNCVPVIGIAVFCAQCSSEEAAFRADCIDVLKERLRAPSTFELIEFTYVPEPRRVTDSSEFRARRAELQALPQNDPERILAEARLRYEWANANGNDDPGVIHKAILEYDADNNFGVPLRTFSECEFDSLGGDYRAGARVRVDGQTSTEWLIDSLQ